MTLAEEKPKSKPRLKKASSFLLTYMVLLVASFSVQEECPAMFLTTSCGFCIPSPSGTLVTESLLTFVLPFLPLALVRSFSGKAAPCTVFFITTTECLSGGLAWVSVCDPGGLLIV